MTKQVSVWHGSKMNALALPAVFFLHMLLGFFAPVGMIYADQGRPLDTIIGQMYHHYLLPSPQVLFIGNPEKASPMASVVYMQDPEFLQEMLDEHKKRKGFYGLVIIEMVNPFPVEFSQLSTWADDLVKPGGYLILYDFKEDKYLLVAQKK